jgi:hypothetical protein
LCDAPLYDACGCRGQQGGGNEKGRQTCHVDYWVKE